jgi:uncharacterized membrane protein YhhN
VNVRSWLSGILPSGSTAVERWLLALSVVAGSLYFVTCAGPPHPAGLVLKALAVSPLAAIAFLLLRGRERWLLGSALAASTLGDVLLELHGLFVPGLGAFLGAHLCYATLFFREWPGRARLTNRQRLLLGLLLVSSTALTVWLWPGLGSLAVPVLFYIAALTAMAAAAIGADARYPPSAWGALLFVLSDSLIGIGRFRSPVPLSDYLVWGTYYVAQCCLALGYLRGCADRPGVRLVNSPAEIGQSIVEAPKKK